MKTFLMSLVFFLILLDYGFAQQYLPIEDDFGVDFVVVKVDGTNIRSYAADSSKSNKSFNKGERLILLNRPDPSLRNWIRVIDLATLKRGWVLTEDVDVFYSRDKDKKGSKRDSGVDGFGSGMGSGSIPPNGSVSPNPVTSRLQILKKPRAGYTDEARQNNTVGQVWLRVEFLSTGKIGRISSVRGLPHGLTQKAIEAASKIVFKPQEENGKPVTVFRVIRTPFSIY